MPQKKSHEAQFRYSTYATLPTKWATFQIHGFEDLINHKEHVVLSLGEINNSKQPVLTRIHSECLTGDALFSLRCDCGAQLQAALKLIADQGKGLLMYIRQEGRGIGLLNKIKAYQIQDVQNIDTVEANEQLGFAADLRSFAICIFILNHFNIKKVNLITNNPQKINALEQEGIQVCERITLPTEETPYNKDYLTAKKNKLGHLLP